MSEAMAQSTPITQTSSITGSGNLAAMLDIPLATSVELGRTELTLAEVLTLGPGAVVELDRSPGEPLDFYANGRLIARGEIMVVNDAFAFRVTEVLTSTGSTMESSQEAHNE